MADPLLRELLGVLQLTVLEFRHPINEVSDEGVDALLQVSHVLRQLLRNLFKQPVHVQDLMSEVAGFTLASLCTTDQCKCLASFLEADECSLTYSIIA